MCNNLMEMVIDIFRPHVSQPKYNDARELGMTSGNQFAEIQVMRQ